MRPDPVVLTQAQLAAALTAYAERNWDLNPTKAGESPVAFGQRVSREAFQIANQQLEERLNDPKPSELPAHDPRYRPKMQTRPLLRACVIVVALGAGIRALGAFFHLF